MEKDEDLLQYTQFVKNNSIQQRKLQGMTWYPIEIKETGYGLGDYPFIIAERTNMRDVPHQFNGGKTVGVFTNHPEYPGEEVNGTVHFAEHNKVKIILYANELPEWLDMGKIGINLLFDENAYKEMDIALKKVINAENGRLAELRDILYGEKQAHFDKIDTRITNGGLNESQLDAVRKIVAAKDVAVIHGPPGTGKTTTLVAALKELIKERKNTPVLLCAPSNTAADLLTEKIAAQGMKVVRIGNLSRIDESILEHTPEGILAKHPEMKRVKTIKKQVDEYRRMASKYKRKFGKDEREQRNLLLKEAKSLAREAIDIENSLVEAIINGADAITCTLVGSMNKFIAAKEFHTVIIDEAAQALEPSTWIPITKARKVILSGDPFQLPPTVKSYQAQSAGLNITLIEKCIQRLPGVSLLTTQYRMHQDIMGFSNQYFYKGGLIAHNSVQYHSLDGIETGFLPVEFIDTAGCSFDEKINPETRSIFNPAEFQILYKHLEGLAQNIASNFSVGVISPYREQVVYMEGQFKNLYAGFPHIQLDINTIDSFQGQERDVIYISLVRSNDKGEIGFLSDYRRMNVAMTRARKKLIIIGDSGTLGSHSFYNQLLEYIEHNGSYRTAWEFQ